MQENLKEHIWWILGSSLSNKQTHGDFFLRCDNSYMYLSQKEILLNFLLLPGGGGCFYLYHLWTAAQGSYNKTHSYCLTLHPFCQTMSRRHPEYIYQLGYSLLKFPHNGCRMTTSAATGTFNISLCSINRGSSNKCWNVGLTLFQLGYVATTPDQCCSRLSLSSIQNIRNKGNVPIYSSASTV